MRIKKDIIETVNELSPRRLLIALDFLEYLKGKEDEATHDVLSDKQLLRDVRTARKDWLKNKDTSFTSWRTVRRDV